MCVDSSLVIDHLFAKFTGENVCIAFAYCDYGNQEQQSTRNMIGGLLKQAITACNNVTEAIINPLLKIKIDRKNLELNDAFEALSKVLESFEKTYLCIDALDECSEKHQKEIIRYINQLSMLSSTDSTVVPVKIFFTGRPHIKDYFNADSSTSPPGPLSITLIANSNDIAEYVKQMLDTDIRGMDDEFKREIVAKIVAASNGM
jgi:hypothetical protein